MPGQKLKSLWAILAVSAVMLCTMSAGSASSASAAGGTFCNGWLDPAWTGNYRCDSPDNVSGYGLRYVFVNTVTRAGCVDYADVWHNLIDSWVCTGKNSQVRIDVRQDGGWYRGTIRNNNLTYSGAFSGIIAVN
jgi:hypothetical protein